MFNERLSRDAKGETHDVSHANGGPDQIACTPAAEMTQLKEEIEMSVSAHTLRIPEDGKPVGGLLKRAFDLVATSVILGLSAPLIAFIAISLICFSPGPVLFAHKRVGFNGRMFSCLKFRTMEVDSERMLQEHLARNPAAAEEWALTQKLQNDPRITWIGAFLRKTSLDELPQLLNVMRGDMSLVGPRPVVKSELLRYGPDRDSYLAARPGITGVWQVSGRNSTTYAERVAFDSRYVATWSLWGDIVIILRTVPAVLFSSRGV